MSTELKNDLEKRMAGAVTAFSNDLKGLRTGRASISMLDTILVESYGNRVPLNQVGTVNAPEARMLSVQVWDQSMAPIVEKAIANSNLGLNPVTDGNLVRVPIPDLSEERRKEIAKVASQYAEKARVAVRNVRRDGMDSLKKMEKDSEISEDEHKSLSDDVQKMTDQHIAEIDQKLKEKEADILSN